MVTLQILYEFNWLGIKFKHFYTKYTRFRVVKLFNCSIKHVLKYETTTLSETRLWLEAGSCSQKELWGCHIPPFKFFLSIDFPNTTSILTRACDQSKTHIPLALFRKKKRWRRVSLKICKLLIGNTYNYNKQFTIMFK